MVELRHVPSDHHENRGQDGQGNPAGVGGEQKHEHQQRYRMNHPGQGRSAAAFYVGGGPGDHAGGGDAAENDRADVGDSLGDQLAVALVPAADHSIGDDGAKKRFDCAAQPGDGGGFGNELDHRVPDARDVIPA